MDEPRADLEIVLVHAAGGGHVGVICNGHVGQTRYVGVPRSKAVDPVVDPDIAAALVPNRELDPPIGFIRPWFHVLEDVVRLKPPRSYED